MTVVETQQQNSASLRYATTQRILEQAGLFVPSSGHALPGVSDTAHSADFDHGDKAKDLPKAKRDSGHRVLMVGAGGIGCELLKNLVMSATPATWTSITIVDLDTIDLSNLNRQFLFQNKHIKQSKAHVARETAMAFNPSGPEMIAHHASIYEDQFNVDWFGSFDLVFNALDNLPARRHVNRMCLAANVPLVESGTAGYLGQVTVHKKSVFSCYDCEPKPSTTNTYPVCTIRSTPSAPIHCVVWAKSFLFSRLFSKASIDGDDEGMSASGTDAPDATKRQHLHQEAQEIAELFAHLGNGPDYAELVFSKIFRTDIMRLRNMPDLWKARDPPILLPDIIPGFAKESLGYEKWDESAITHDQGVWDLDKNITMFMRSITTLASRMTVGLTEQGSQFSLEFDKDDPDALDFVTAASNIRSHIFGIKPMSRFDLKQMAGNIIPAIATTNAIVAGFMVISAFKILSGRYSDCRNTFLSYGGSRSQVFMSETPLPPQPGCDVCQVGYFKLECPSLRSDAPDSVAPLTIKSILDAISQSPHGDWRGFGIGQEITVQQGDRLLYDIEFDDYLEVDIKAKLKIQAGYTLVISYETEKEEDLLRLSLTLEASKDVKETKLCLTGDFDRLPTLFKAKPKLEVESPAKRSSEDVAPDDESGASKKAKLDLEDDVVADVDDDDIIIL